MLSFYYSTWMNPPALPVDFCHQPWTESTITHHLQSCRFCSLSQSDGVGWDLGHPRARRPWVTIGFPQSSSSFPRVNTFLFVVCLWSFWSTLEYLFIFLFYPVLYLLSVVENCLSSSHSYYWKSTTWVVDIRKHQTQKSSLQNIKPQNHPSSLKYTWCLRMVLVDCFQNKEPV